MPIADREIWTIAEQYVKRHGAEALARARERMAILEAEGDAEGKAIWALVGTAIEEIQRVPPRDRPLN